MSYLSLQSLLAIGFPSSSFCMSPTLIQFSVFFSFINFIHSSLSNSVVTAKTLISIPFKFRESVTSFILGISFLQCPQSGA